jgi:hypothetical protein
MHDKKWRIHMDIQDGQRANITRGQGRKPGAEDEEKIEVGE